MCNKIFKSVSGLKKHTLVQFDLVWFYFIEYQPLKVI